VSYCRFSSDDWKSDVYCYEAISCGFVVHIAGNRVLGEIPATPPMTKENIPAYMEAHKAQMAFLDKCERAPIDLPHAGGSMDFDDAGSCADGLEMLRGLGYHVPQYAIDALREEAAEVSDEPVGAERKAP
jgi:hypothetical protein